MHGDAIRLGHRDGIEMVFLADGEESGLVRSSSELSDFAQMAAVLDGLRALGSGRVLDEVLTLVLDSAIEATRAERGFVMLADQQSTLEFKTARGRGKMTLPGTSFTTSEKIPREVFATGKSRIVGDLLDGNFADDHGGTIAVGIRHVVCVPLLVGVMASASASGRRAASSACCIWTGKSAAPCCRRPRAARWRRLPRRRRWRSRARGCTPSRPRRRASTATCASPPRSSRRCCPSRTTTARCATSPRPRCRAARSEATSTITWRWTKGSSALPSATWRERGRRRPSWPPWSRATSPRRRQSAAIQRRRWPASTRRCCAVPSKRGSRPCATAS